MIRTATFWVKLLAYLSLMYLTYLMILITVQYFPLKMDAAFLNIKREVIILTHYQVAFFSHVYTSVLVLILGIPQFSKTIRTHYPVLHKTLGKFYIALVLLVASPSGLVMGYYANGGFFSQLSFCIQAILWFFFTLQAFRFAQKKEWDQHQKFMLRSFALTLSAISLRLFKWMIVSTLALPPMDTYRIVSWLGWSVNLLIVEIYLIKSDL